MLPPTLKNKHAAAKMIVDRAAPPHRGGQRPGAGRPAGSSKPDSRRNRLTQRYSDSEMQLLTAAAERCGYGDNLTEYVRDQALNRAVIVPQTRRYQ